ncbi:uncharacterized protein [Euwallacea fornicatus]|uniref:uncharacterized protein n=1 Tax=Euwallacea fornicatus TaxID=995702 RepID=UPI00338D4680
MIPQARCCIRKSFVHNVLSALNTLQDAKGNTSIKFGDLVKFMEHTYDLGGDIRSQIESALLTAQDLKFVIKINDRYSLISPAARLQLVSAICLKEETKRIEDIFPFRKRKGSAGSSYGGIALKKPKSESPVRSSEVESTADENHCECQSLKFLKNLLSGTVVPAANSCSNTDTETSKPTKSGVQSKNCRKEYTNCKQKKIKKKKKKSSAHRRTSLDKQKKKIVSNQKNEQSTLCKPSRNYSDEGFDP